jgi:cytochrome c biogenesis protein CcdA/peroxiredoxin
MKKQAKNWEEEPLTGYVFTIFTVVVLFVYFFWVFGAVFPTAVLWSGLLFTLLLAFLRKPLREAESVADFWYRATESLQLALISDTRQLNRSQDSKSGYLGSLGLGVVFSAGWTPCIGPIYASVLVLANDAAASGGSLLPSGLMLTSYSLGLGIPFLLTALAFNQSTAVMNRIKRHMATVERVSGVFLIIIGVLILSGGLTDLSASFGTGELGDLSIRMEACTGGLAEGRLHASMYPECISEGFEKINNDRLVQAADKVQVGLMVGDRPENFSFQTDDGETQTLWSLWEDEGQNVLLYFWTFDEPASVEALSQYEETQDEYGRGSFTVLALNAEDSAESVHQFGEENSFDIQLASTENLSSVYGTPTAGESFFIEGNGVLRDTSEAPLPEDRIVALLDSIRFENPAPVDNVAVGLEEGERAPNFTVDTLEGERQSLEDFRGQFVLLNFWATWCGPCRAEMPEFESIYQLNRHRGFQVFAVDFEESEDQVEDFVNELGLNFTIGLDENGEVGGDLYRVNSFPTSYVVDSNGVIIARHQGPLSGEGLLDILEEYAPAELEDIETARTIGN